MFDKNVFMEKFQQCKEKRHTMYNFKNYDAWYTILFKESLYDRNTVDFTLYKNSIGEQELVMHFYQISYDKTIEIEEMCDVIKNELREKIPTIDDLIEQVGAGQKTFKQFNNINKIVDALEI